MIYKRLVPSIRRHQCELDAADLSQAVSPSASVHYSASRLRSSKSIGLAVAERDVAASELRGAAFTAVSVTA